MNDELINIIPKKEEKIEDEKSTNWKAIFLTVIFLVVVAAAIYGFIFVYNNYVNTDSVDLEKEFLLAAENCQEAEYVKETETLNILFLTAYIKLENKYNIKGKNEDNKCLIDIEILNAEMKTDLESIINYIYNDKHKKKVYKDYLILQTLKGELDDVFNDDMTEEEAELKLEELLENTDQEIEHARETLKSHLTEHYESLDEQELEEYKSSEEIYPSQIIGTVQNCTFENENKVVDFLKTHFTSDFDNFNIDTKTIDGKTFSVTEYDGGECISEIDNTLN